MKSRTFTILSIAVFTLLLSACADSKGEHAKGNITESVWGLVSVKAPASNSILIPPKDKIPTLEVMSDGTVKGTTGCNSFEGQAALANHNLTFGNLIKTKIICPDAPIESAYFSMLDSVDNYTVDHGHLLLKKGHRLFATLMSLDMR